MMCCSGESPQPSDHMLSTLLSVRGGSQSEATAVYITSAISYFNNLRVPAAVLGSIIMKEMYALQNTPPASMRDWDIEKRIDKSKGWRTLRYTYLLLMVLAFCLETNTIFVATQVLTSLATTSTSKYSTELSLEMENDKIGGLFTLGRREVHQSMVGFLIKNFEFEYTTVRFHFVTGLMSFTVAQALRVRYALRKYTSLSMSGMCCMLTVASGALAYTNANTITYGGYVNLMKRQLLLSRNFISKHVRSGPMSAVTAILALLTIYYAIIGYFSPEFSYFELELQEDKESSSTLKWLKNSHGR
ncbi:hypothetical protein ACHAW6_005636 [Cyclotella cf. meneghiniana]